MVCSQTQKGYDYFDIKNAHELKTDFESRLITVVCVAHSLAENSASVSGYYFVWFKLQ